MSEVISIETAKEERIDIDSAIAKRLMLQAETLSDQLVGILKIGSAEIKDKQQLKALVEHIKYLANEKIIDGAIDVDVGHRLYEIDQIDDFEGNN